MARKDLGTKLKEEGNELNKIKKECGETKKKASELGRELNESRDKFKRILEEIAEKEFGKDDYWVNILPSQKKVVVLRTKKHKCDGRCLYTVVKDEVEIMKTIKFEELE